MSFEMPSTAAPAIYHSYVDGAWTPGSNGTIDVVDPATDTTLAHVSVASLEQCREAVDAAARAQGDWAVRSPRDRAQILMTAYELMRRDEELLARLITMENGKALVDARGEANYAAEFFRWFAEEAVRVPGDLRCSPSGQNWIAVSHEPVGVALLITPWNFPAAMATRKIAPALAAGCAVVLKPATETPLAALFVAHLLEEAGVPAGVVNVVVATPAGPAVNAMLEDRRVRAVSFTGSTEVGKLLLREAAGNVAKPSMELGGNAPFLVLDDADLDEAVEGLMLAKFRNGGAACTAANRILVQSGVADAFVERITARIEALRMGDGSADGTEIGPMVSRKERDRVAALVDAAVRAGAKVVTGGDVPDREGFFYTPTLLDGVLPDSDIAETEIFGPVAVVIRFDEVDQGIAWANATDAGLVSYVFTQGLESGVSVSRRLESGMVGLNRGLVSDPAAPFGGSKQSGLGREGASDGLLEFMEPKYIAMPYI
jgi:succinate-semialdehyde dehydrogenase/glutarate-semialdehyde dehydrogenase